MKENQDNDLTVEEKYDQLLKELEIDDKDKLTDEEECIQAFVILIAVFINLFLVKFICEYFNLYSYYMIPLIWHILVWIEAILVCICFSKKWWIVSFDQPIWWIFSFDKPKIKK